MDIASLKVGEECSLIGKTLSEIDFRSKYSATILAILRGEEVIANPSGSNKLHKNDIIYILSKPQQIPFLAKNFNLS